VGCNVVQCGAVCPTVHSVNLFTLGGMSQGADVGASGVRQRSERVRPARRFGPDKVHASLREIECMYRNNDSNINV